MLFETFSNARQKVPRCFDEKAALEEEKYRKIVRIIVKRGIARRIDEKRKKT